MSLKLVTWNINSLRARADHVAEYLDEHHPHLLLMQEIKMEDEAVPWDLFEDREYWLETHGQKAYNGVATAAWDDELDDIHKGLPGGDDGQARLLATTWRGIRVVNVYCPQGQSVDSPKFEHKQRFFRTLIDWLGANHDPSEPLILAGDINIAPEPTDVWDADEFGEQVTRHPKELALFGELLDWGLHDATRPHLDAGVHTFWDYRTAAWERGRGMRIDFFLVTKPVMERVVGASVDLDERDKDKASDHAPVVLELSE